MQEMERDCCVAPVVAAHSQEMDYVLHSWEHGEDLKLLDE